MGMLQQSMLKKMPSVSRTQAPGIDLTGASREWREDTGTQSSRESLMEKPQYPGSTYLLQIVVHGSRVYGVQLNHGGFVDTGESRRQT